MKIRICRSTETAEAVYLEVMKSLDAQHDENQEEREIDVGHFRNGREHGWHFICFDFIEDGSKHGLHPVFNIWLHNCRGSDSTVVNIGNKDDTSRYTYGDEAYKNSRDFHPGQVKEPAEYILKAIRDFYRENNKLKKELVCV